MLSSFETRLKFNVSIKILQAENQREPPISRKPPVVYFMLLCCPNAFVGLVEEFYTTEETFRIARAGNVFALEVLREEDYSVHRSDRETCYEAFGACISIIPVDSAEGRIGAEFFVTSPDSPLTSLGILVTAAVEVTILEECLPRSLLVISFGVSRVRTPQLRLVTESVAEVCRPDLCLAYLALFVAVVIDNNSVIRIDIVVQVVIFNVIVTSTAE